MECSLPIATAKGLWWRDRFGNEVFVHSAFLVYLLILPVPCLVILLFARLRLRSATV